MDNLKQLGKILRKNNDVANHNIRRAKENFPLIARTNDKVSPAQSFKHEFLVTDHPHRVSASLFFREPEPPCEVVPIDQLASLQAQCPGFGPADGNLYAGNGDFAVTNVGGFYNNGSGWVVPVTGIYEIHVINAPAGVSLSANTHLVWAIVVGGATVAQKFFGVDVDRIPYFYAPPVDMWATVAITAGSVVNQWASATDVAFWTPSDFCGLFGGSYMTIELVAEA